MSMDIIARGIAATKADLVNGKVPAEQLPSYVDDVVEGYYDETTDKFYKDAAHTQEIPGEEGKIYVDKIDSISYRWSGTTFTAIGAKGAVQGVKVNDVELEKDTDGKVNIVLGNGLKYTDDGQITIKSGDGTISVSEFGARVPYNTTSLDLNNNGLEVKRADDSLLAYNSGTGNKGLKVNQEVIQGKLIAGSGISISSSNVISANVKTYRPLKSKWKQSTSVGGLTLAEFCGAINADPEVEEGDAYCGNINSQNFFNGVYLEEPGAYLTSAEVNVQIMGPWGTGHVMLLTTTSSNNPPYYWQYTWVDGLAHWVSWTDVRKLSTSTTTNELKYLSINGTEYKLVAANSGSLTKALTAQYTVGGIDAGKTYPIGTNIEDILTDLLRAPTPTTTSYVYHGKSTTVPTGVTGLTKVQAVGALLVDNGYTITNSFANEYPIVAIDKTLGVICSGLSQGGFDMEFLSVETTDQYIYYAKDKVTTDTGETLTFKFLFQEASN